MKSPNYCCASTSVKEEHAATHYSPKFSVDHSAEGNRVYVELPGVTKEDLNLALENDELKIEAKASYKWPETWKPLHRESVDRVYRLSLRLGHQVKQTAIGAELSDGILTLIIPKEEAAKRRTITVK